MTSKDDTITIKGKHFSLILFVLGLLVGALAGYYFGFQPGANLQSGSGGADDFATGDSGTGSGESVFVKYAGELKLDTKKFESCLNNGKYAEDVNSDLQAGLGIGIGGTPGFVVNGQLIQIGAAPYESFQDILEYELKNATERSMALSLVSRNDPTLGDKNAPIIMIEFSDFQCPFCARHWKDAYKSIKKDYVETGKVLFVYKDFPLNRIHQKAQKAAEAAQCANEQGKFWEYHDVLFSKQVEWSR